MSSGAKQELVVVGKLGSSLGRSTGLNLVASAGITKGRMVRVAEMPTNVPAHPIYHCWQS